MNNLYQLEILRKYLSYGYNLIKIKRLPKEKILLRILDRLTVMNKLSTIILSNNIYQNLLILIIFERKKSAKFNRMALIFFV